MVVRIIWTDTDTHRIIDDNLQYLDDLGDSAVNRLFSKPLVKSAVIEYGDGHTAYITKES